MTYKGEKKKIFVIAGEASGDVLGGALLSALREKYGDDVEFAGIGGSHMADAGLESLIPMEELCVMGLVEVLEHLSRLRKLIGWVANQIEDFQPDAVVMIDLPDFNFRVAKLCKRRNYDCKLIHYVAPTVWAWRPGRAKYISKFLDGLMCLFPFEPDYFTPHGLKTKFVGHPLVERDWFSGDTKVNVMNEFKKTREIPENADLLAIMFGSRVSEFKAHSEVFADTLKILREKIPNLQLIVPTLPHLQFEVMDLLSKLKIPAYIILDEKEKREALSGVNAALAVSGTVALELSYADIPHVVAYRTSWINYFLLKILVKTKFAHLANILLGKMVVPEYLQVGCSPEALATGVLRLMKVPEIVAQQRAGFKAVRKKLSPVGQQPSECAADFVFDIIEE